MTLKEANFQVERLENEYEYWLREKENLLSLITPQSPNVSTEKVDGGKREDRFFRYIELEDEKQINATLDYIWRKKTNLMNWIEEELKIIGAYEPIEQKIIMLRDDEKKKWEDIARIVGYCQRQCQRIYNKYKKRITKKRSQ